MAALTDQDREDVWEEFMRRNPDAWGAVEKADLRTAVNNLDAWVDSNKASALASLDEPAASELSGVQVALVFTLIVDKRFLKGV